MLSGEKFYKTLWEIQSDASDPVVTSHQRATAARLNATPVTPFDIPEENEIVPLTPTPSVTPMPGITAQQAREEKYQGMTIDELQAESDRLNNEKVSVGARIADFFDRLAPSVDTLSSKRNDADGNEYYIDKATGKRYTPDTVSTARDTRTTAEKWSKEDEVGILQDRRTVASTYAKKQGEQSYSAVASGDADTKKNYSDYVRYSNALDAIESYADPEQKSDYDRIDKSTIGELSQFLIDYGIQGVRLTGNRLKDTRAIMTAAHAGKDAASQYLSGKGIDAEHARRWDLDRIAQLNNMVQTGAAEAEVDAGGWSAIKANIKSIGAQAASGVEFIGKTLSAIGSSNPKGP